MFLFFIVGGGGAFVKVELLALKLLPMMWISYVCSVQSIIHIYIPGIYAEGYIVFVFPFVCSYFLPSLEFVSKFCVKVSQVVYISATTHQKAYLDHSYPGGLAFTPLPRTPGSMPRGRARGQNLGHLYKCIF